MSDYLTLEAELAKLPAATQAQVREAARQIQQVLDGQRESVAKAAAIELARATLYDSICY